MREFGKHDTTEEDLASNLPPWFPKDPSSGNYSLLKPIAEVLDEVNEERQAVDKAVHPTKAETIDQLQALAQLVDVDPYKNESLEHYRVRVISEFQLLTSKGTVQDLLNASSTILSTTVDRIKYTEEHTQEGGKCRLGVPANPINRLELADGEFVEIVGELIPSGYSVELFKKGTFTYLSKSEWANTRQSNYSGSFTFITTTTYGDSNHNSTKGHDGLDTSGNPKDTGGTYSGISPRGTNDPEKSYDGLNTDGNPKDSGGTYAGTIE